MCVSLTELAVKFNEPETVPDVVIFLLPKFQPPLSVYPIVATIEPPDSISIPDVLLPKVPPLFNVIKPSLLVKSAEVSVSVENATPPLELTLISVPSKLTILSLIFLINLVQNSFA